ncbi:MAG: histone-lysine N-methyltransferase [Deltaproteobacteria bacterium]|jgi:isopropylmalate/homocitrate/citramalate synthase|nr:histone-lysine N-methyltransferase [Deltaproteobacteria bacterium]
MPLLHRNNKESGFKLKTRKEPQLYRDIFPYSRVARIPFDDSMVMLNPAEPMFITDTTFRDGQQARPPYTPRQIAAIFDLLHELGGRSGLINSSEFFMYSEKDRQAIELCRNKNYKFPRITGWLRATPGDLRLAKNMEFREVGLLTSVSDYHIYLKLGWDRRKAFDNYIRIAEQALEWGISPRCHFEDVTRADIYGFCLPLAEKLMSLSRESGLPVKIRLCDTMGFGVPYAGATLPRSVPRLVWAFVHEAGVPGEWLEWHGHNDFHKGLVNGVTAWLYGCSGINGTLLGFGERTGNTPVEGLVMEYISLTGNDEAANTKIITSIADYFSSELEYRIPDNYPFAGKDFNATSAGVHVDGLAKNEEIYNIFDSELILGKPVPIIITDKTGRAGVAYWINRELNLEGERKISKSHPSVGVIHERILAAYEKGRTTSFSNKEMLALTRRFMPELFISDFTRLKRAAGDLAAELLLRLASECKINGSGQENYPWMMQSVQDYPFIQYLYLTDTRGRLLAAAITDPAYRERYDSLPVGYDFSQRQWFIRPMRSGRLHVTDLYQSHFTEKLILTVSAPVLDERDGIAGIVGADIQLEELLKRADMLEENEPEKD